MTPVVLVSLPSLVWETKTVLYPIAVLKVSVNLVCPVRMIENVRWAQSVILARVLRSAVLLMMIA